MIEILLPMVSVIIPCFNEQKFIGGCLETIVANDYPKDKLEVLVIDGMSTDQTRAILKEYAQKHSFIRMVDNPDRVKPKALNIGIQLAKGDIIIRMDAHAIYEPDYIFKSVKYLDEYNADNTGGVRKTLPGNNSVIARSIAYSISHPFAVGNATYRTGSKTIKWVDTVFGGCYRKETFEKMGLFNEVLTRGQDREFNVRLQREGGKILLAPDIVCHYYARSDLKEYFHWIFVGGLTPIYISKITRKIIFSWRNLIPLLFVSGLVFLFLLGFAHPVFWLLLLATVMLHTTLGFYFSIAIAQQEGEVKFLLTMPFVFLAIHILYGIGSLVGVFKPVDYQSEWSKV